MTTQWHNLRAQWRIIGGAIIVGAVLAFTIVALVPARFESNIQILVVQNQHVNRADAAAAVRLTTYFTHVMANAIYTTSFFAKVQEAPFDVRKDFSTDPVVRTEQWERAVRVETREEAGMIRISVRDTSRTTAEATAKGIAYVLTTKNNDYRGENDGIVVRMVDGPTTPFVPTLPRIMPWTIVGGVTGGVLMMIAVVFFPGVLPGVAKEPPVRGVRHDDEMQEDLLFVQRRNDDPVSAPAITAHFHNVAHHEEPRNLPVADTALFEASGEQASNGEDETVAEEHDDVPSEETVDAEVASLYAQIDAFHKTNNAQ